MVFLADGGTDHAVELLRRVPGIGELLIVDPWELNQLPVARVEDLPIRLTGIAGWLPGKWEECRRRMLRGEAALPLQECVNPLFLDLIRWDREYARARFLREVGAIVKVNVESERAGWERTAAGGISSRNEVETGEADFER